MKTQRDSGVSKAMFISLVLIGTSLLGLKSVFAQVQHPLAARRVPIHRVHERRENVVNVRQQRAENIAGRRATAAATRIVLPRYSRATFAASGSIVLPGASATPATSRVVTQPAPSTASSAEEAEEYEGLPSDELPDMFAGSTSYPVARIEDGGATVVLKTDQGETKVRMIGVAAVTLGQGSSLPQRFSGLRLPSTERFVENLLKGESVYVVYDTQVAEEDADKKCVAYLFRAPDGLMVNLEVIRAGFAVTDTSYDFDQKTLFTKYQNTARQAGKGIYALVQRIRTARGDTNE